MAYKFTTMPISELTNPNRGGYFYHLIDHYWGVTENEEVVFYGLSSSPYAHPQCNRQIMIAEKLTTSPLLAESGITIKETRLIPIAFQPINIADYQ